MGSEEGCVARKGVFVVVFVLFGRIKIFPNHFTF